MFVTVERAHASPAQGWGETTKIIEKGSISVQIRLHILNGNLGGFMVIWHLASRKSDSDK